jgi:hypothetical protein
MVWCHQPSLQADRLHVRQMITGQKQTDAVGDSSCLWHGITPLYLTLQVARSTVGAQTQLSLGTLQEHVQHAQVLPSTGHCKPSPALPAACLASGSADCPGNCTRPSSPLSLVGALACAALAAAHKGIKTRSYMFGSHTVPFQ